jgi:hypothetical protein
VTLAILTLRYAMNRGVFVESSETPIIPLYVKRNTIPISRSKPIPISREKNASILFPENTPLYHPRITTLPPSQ